MPDQSSQLKAIAMTHGLCKMDVGSEEILPTSNAIAALEAAFSAGEQAKDKEFQDYRREDQQYKFHLESALDEAKEKIALFEFYKSPCGHSSQYAYTMDGGKNIVCLVCEYERALSLDPAPPTEKCPECGSDDKRERLCTSCFKKRHTATKHRVAMDICQHGWHGVDPAPDFVLKMHEIRESVKVGGDRDPS